MNTATRKRSESSYEQVLKAVLALPPVDQHRLYDELAKLVGVTLVRPIHGAAAVRRGCQQAKAIRVALGKMTAASLDEAMGEMRGRSWSS